MHKIPRILGALAAKMKPKLVLDAARRFLNSPTARMVGEAVRRRITEAVQQGAIELLIVLLAGLPTRPDRHDWEDER